jgi:AcrR family transcriptional regulator
VARAERLAVILEAGARVLGERGYHGASMRDVAEAADTSLGTLYHYLGGKEDLLYQVQRRVLEAAVASAWAALAARGARDRLRALLTDHVRRVLARPVEAAILAGTLGAPRGERGRRIEALRQDYLALVRATSEAAVRRSRARRREAESRALMLLGMADRLALDALANRQTVRPSLLAGRALQVFLHGARPRARG